MTPLQYGVPVDNMLLFNDELNIFNTEEKDTNLCLYNELKPYTDIGDAILNKIS